MPDTTTAGDTAARMKPIVRPSAIGMPNIQAAMPATTRASAMPGHAVRRIAVLPALLSMETSSSRPDLQEACIDVLSMKLWRAASKHWTRCADH